MSFQAQWGVLVASGPAESRIVTARGARLFLTTSGASAARRGCTLPAPPGRHRARPARDSAPVRHTGSDGVDRTTPSHATSCFLVVRVSFPQAMRFTVLRTPSARTQASHSMLDRLRVQPCRRASSREPLPPGSWWGVSGVRCQSPVDRARLRARTKRFLVRQRCLLPPLRELANMDTHPPAFSSSDRCSFLRSGSVGARPRVSRLAGCSAPSSSL